MDRPPPRKLLVDEAAGLSTRCVAHDLNNVLTSILGSADLALARYEQGTDPRPHLNDIILTAYRASGLVQMLLQENAKARPMRRLVSLGEITEEALDSLRSEIPSSVEVVAGIGDQGAVLGDPVQLYRMVLNLLTNALQSLGADGGKLEIRVGRGPTSLDDPLVLTVWDTGIGIREQDLPHVFEPFFTTRAERGGTGLGLSVVQEVAEAHDGEVRVESQLGQGTTFTVRLPRGRPRP